MIDFNKPHAVPQTTKSLINTDQKARQRQARAYDADRANNHRQMDDIRHAQYRKQNTAVNKQKSHMQDNAAKASKRVTGSSDYYKEERTLQDFLDLCEGRQARKRKERKEAREQQRAQQSGRTTEDDRADTRTKKEKAAQTSPDSGKGFRSIGVKRATDPSYASRKQRELKRGTSQLKTKQKRKAQEKQAEAQRQAEEEKAKKAREIEAGKEAVKAKKRKDKEERERRTTGFGSGLKSALGGDVLSRDEKQRRKARTEAGKRVGKFARNAPGNIVKAGLKTLGGINRRHNKQAGGGGSGGPSGSLAGVSHVND